MFVSDFDVSTLRSNSFEMEWPNGSGKLRRFPEVDAAAWIDVSDAATCIHKNQIEVATSIFTYLSSSHRARRGADVQHFTSNMKDVL